MREICRKSGFFILGIFSLPYVIFSRKFAEIHIYIPLLDFPVFMGEFLLLVCFILSFFVFDFRSIRGRQWIVVLYFIWVILKALWGYWFWGPLSFRHAALFYYPAFIFFGFIFFKKESISDILKIGIVLSSLALCVTRYYRDYWTLTLWILAFILIRSLQHERDRYSLYTCLLATILFSYKSIIVTSRTFISGNAVAGIFLMISLLLIAKIRTFYKAIIAVTAFTLFTVFIYAYSLVNASGTIIDIAGIVNRYKMVDEVIREERSNYAAQTIEGIKLFSSGRHYTELGGRDGSSDDNPEESHSFEPAKDRILRLLGKKPESKVGMISISKTATREKSRIINASPLNVPVKNIKPVKDARIAEDAYGNTLFRIFIWRDMIVEFSRSRPILGFSFGKPLRCPSLEILHWGGGDWMFTGWMEPHNSYLHMLYRMGILGVALIGFLIWQLCGMIKSFIAFRSLPGVLLCAILINWMVAANFLPLLELPYDAIPFWLIWGMALKYLKELKNNRHEDLSHS